jgi:predicted MFS family arabinose efflux permease
MSIQFNSTGTPHTLEANEKIPVTDPSTTQSVSVAHDESNLQEEGVGGAVDKRMSNLRWFVVCVGLYLTAFLYGLDSTIAADVQGPILASLGELRLLPWVGTGFLLGSVATVSLFGSLYTKIEVKWLYLASILTFEVGSAICGAAPNMQAMVVGRVVAGVGGSGVYLG